MSTSMMFNELLDHHVMIHCWHNFDMIIRLTIIHYYSGINDVFAKMFVDQFDLKIVQSIDQQQVFGPFNNKKYRSSLLCLLWGGG